MPSVYQFDPSRDPFSPYGFSCQRWQPTLMPKPDRHNEIEINFLQSGSVTYVMGGSRTTIQAGRIGLFWAAIPHQIVAWEGAEPYFVVTLPLGWFLAAGVSAGFAQLLLKGGLAVDPAPLSTDLAHFQRWESDLREKDQVGERAALLEIQARLLRLAHAHPKASKARAVPPSFSRADQLACYIARNYHKPLTAENIAKASGLHPNYAMNLFRQAFGTTMTDFIVQHRLSHAQRLLLTTNETVTEIAFASGFQSLSRFNEAFKKSCECSPRQYRNGHRSD